MAFTQKVTQTWTSQEDRRVITNVQEFTAGKSISIDESLEVASDSSGEQVALALDVDQLQLLYILCDVAIVIRTNDDTSPTESISVSANVPIVWHAGSVHSNPITSDITTDIFVRLAVAGTGPVRFQLQALIDPTA